MTDGDFLPGDKRPSGPVPPEPPHQQWRDDMHTHHKLSALLDGYDPEKHRHEPVLDDTPVGREAGSEGLRFDDGKARFDLLPPEAMEALAHHYRLGGRKYADRNWELGMAWCRCFGSMMRHAWAWMRGEDVDAETGSHHMIAVAWNAIAIFTYSVRKVGTDDRPRA